MKSKKVKKTASSKPQSYPHLTFHLREGIFILNLALSIFLLIALATYHQADPAWSSTGIPQAEVMNAAGHLGAWLSDILLHLFGYTAFLLPVGLTYAIWAVLYAGRNRPTEKEPVPRRLVLVRALSSILGILSLCGLIALYFSHKLTYISYPGGILGSVVLSGLQPWLGNFGTVLFLFALTVASVSMSTKLSWFVIIDRVGLYTLNSFAFLQRITVSGLVAIKNYGQKLKLRAADEDKNLSKRAPTLSTAPKLALSKKSKSNTKQPVSEEATQPVIAPKIARIEPSKRAVQECQTVLFENTSNGILPALGLLDKAKKDTTSQIPTEFLQQMSRAVEAHLKDFGIEVKVVAVHPGPVVTRYEMQLAPGVKVSKITTLAKDLARSLSVMSVRIVEVIQGKSVVGLEVPNDHRETVLLSEVLASEAYDRAQSPLSIALGKDIAGLPKIVDLAKMPHLLVAGTTGSGKSVSINAMLLSLLYKATPQQLRLILIDPKMLELSVYEGIPHLLTPVVTDMKQASNALRWCVGEMERRYRLLAALGVRNLSNFNKKIREANAKEQPIKDPLWHSQDPEATQPDLQELPYIVVIIDELADMMMVVGKKVEQLIARIAQKARAAGIHLVLATQRPSVDVITGLIKANIPTRVAFQVSSKIDSRTIIDQQGAEQLLGHGDMLYLPSGVGVPMRVHGAFVADHEVHNVVADLKKHGTPEYLEDILESSAGEVDPTTGMPEEEEGAEADPLYDQAVAIVIETRRASISSIQRRLKIGYNRAARLVEAMEKSGLVGPMESNGSREVLVPAPQE
jgi:S-DNA-T family DNA segregation ATPase FtsK/SpoIIIE